MSALEADLPARPSYPSEAATLDQLVVVIAAECVNFRLPSTLTANLHPQLTRWLQAMAQRPHMAATAFA